MLVYSSFFLKSKALKVMLILMGPAGGGKSTFLNIFSEVFTHLSKEMQLDEHFCSKELNSSRANSEEHFLFFTHEPNSIKKVDFGSLKSLISDHISKTSVRQVYQASDQKNNHCSASYAVAHNEEGITYHDKNIYKLSDSFVRRLFGIYFPSIIAGSKGITEEIKTYYLTIRKLKILNHNDKEFMKQLLGCLFFALDLIQYFNIGDWDSNNIIKASTANMRRAVREQYLPIKVLTSFNLIFLDEIYPDDSLEMKRFCANDKGIALKQHLLSDSLPYEKLTDNNLDIIADSLKKILSIDIRLVNGEWKIFGAKKYRDCTEKELLAYNNPQVDIFDYGSKFNPNDVQACLPRAQQFFISEDIKSKYNKVIQSLFIKKKLNFEVKPKLADNYFDIDTNIYLKKFKNYEHL
jgi:energy-coupling factor transporter ATP-binding protein EcfA2